VARLMRGKAVEGPRCLNGQIMPDSAWLCRYWEMGEERAASERLPPYYIQVRPTAQHVFYVHRLQVTLCCTPTYPPTRSWWG
jgi:hypothetical protein